MLHDDQDLHERLARLARAVREPVVHQGMRLQVGISIGTARAADLPERTLSAALKAADTAMYAVKGRGRRGRWHPALAAVRRFTAPLRDRLHLAV